MFTGIVEAQAKLVSITKEGSNKHFEFEIDFLNELYIDQSISHNGVCLTVVELREKSYVVTAIEETLSKTNLGKLKAGDFVNIERSMLPNTRLDGHLVQGHVDTTVQCLNYQERDGSWIFQFKLPQDLQNLIVSKGSICINGVSLTVVDPSSDRFSVAIIPYTFEHTNFRHLKAGDSVNIEFDVIGKYVAKQWEAYKK